LNYDKNHNYTIIMLKFSEVLNKFLPTLVTYIFELYIDSFIIIIFLCCSFFIFLKNNLNTFINFLLIHMYKTRSKDFKLKKDCQEIAGLSYNICFGLIDQQNLISFHTLLPKTQWVSTWNLIFQGLFFITRLNLIISS